ncbi:S8 family serine peptidase [Bdellovibrio bacteriovorus]|uniref:S8 family serine peptidase n=1 Tax=Bdellovibrio bacteriovorus TaxID=959 RepID=UPI003AA9BFF4
MRTSNPNTTPRIFSSLLISALLFTACSPSAQAPKGQIFNSDFLEGLYSNRPTVEDPYIFIVKLSNPALLETAQRKDGKLVIDKKLLAAIQAEQEATVEELKKISSDIKVLIRYKLVLNGFAVWAPANVYEKIKSVPNITLSEKAGSFARPMEEDDINLKGLVGKNTSVNFIGSEAAYAQNIRGQGMRVGVIDTGVDYTHKMLGGEGTEEAYKAVNPNEAHASFPNKKVVGGIDIVGSEYNSGHTNPLKRIPVPDANPLDEATHGTHVAGTVAGVGDGVNTYSGVAPDADLYAIKVFGAKGSTSDEVVIAALEYAADPTGDLTFQKQLDVVNLSLGSGYGNPHIMYNHAIKNLVRGGTIVVAAAGNNGDLPYIVGAPSVSDDAISVANSIDNMNQNVQFPAAEFTVSGEALIVEATEGAISKPLADVQSLKEELVYIGTAAKPLDEATKARLQGKIALIDRGEVNFSVKIQAAQENGAIGVVVANNAEGAPIVMGGEGKFDIPAIMIDLASAKKVKAGMAQSPVVVDLKTTAKIEKPWMADTISPSSSRGPRSEDGIIKPEISAPGTNIISAASRAGDKGANMTGTSMASPHIAGVMALLKQKYNALSPAELKSVLLAHGKVINAADKKVYSVSRQGAGRVQVAESLNAKIVTVPAAVSFGITDVEKQKTLAKEITVKNISDESVTLTAHWTGSEALQISAPAVTLAAGESKTVLVKAKINASLMENQTDELDGYLSLKSQDQTLAQLPALAVTRKISRISASSLVVHSSSKADSAGSLAEVVLKNDSVNPGEAYLFNLLGADGRKKSPKQDLVHNRNCDLQSAGYRVIESDKGRVLQVALKLYEGMTTWQRCEVNVQIDSNGDGLADQELAGLPASDLPGMTGDDFVSLLLDGNQAREMRRQYEKDFAADPGKAKEDYSGAVLDMRGMGVFDNSTLAIIEADISMLSFAETGEISLKVSTTHGDNGAIEYDDYLGEHSSQWEKVSVNTNAQAYTQIPEVIELDAQSSTTVNLIKGYGAGDLILYAPQNRSVRDVLLEDNQSQLIPALFSDEN